MNFKVIKWSLYGEGTPYVLHSRTQFYSCFLLRGDGIRWCFTCKMTFRMVFQIDLEVCCIEPNVVCDKRGSSFSRMQFLEEPPSDFTVCLS